LRRYGDLLFNSLGAPAALLVALVTLLPGGAQAQGVEEAWVQRYNGPGGAEDTAHKAVIDSAGNVIVAGNTDNRIIGRDILVIKYTSTGIPLWTNRYNGPANAHDSVYYPCSIAVDASDNVVVAGYSTGLGTGKDYLTIKYSSAGVPLWTNCYNGPGNDDDRVCGIAVDPSGNVYVTGGSAGIGSGADHATIKYSSSGEQLWVNRLTGTGSSTDRGKAIAVDASGNVYVTGGVALFDNADFTTIKYSSTGEQLWINYYNGPANADDGATAIAVDTNGNVYVTGESTCSSTGYDHATVKYSSAGQELWVQRYDGPVNGYDTPTSIALDASGNVFVTGYSTGSGSSFDFTTIKYSSTGEQLWVQRYNGPGNSYDRAWGIAVDASGNVFVTGCSYGSGSANDFTTIKYSSAGAQLWARTYNGPGNGYDEAWGIAVDASGNAYVTGWSTGSGNGLDFARIKYSSAGAQLWVNRHDEPGNRPDSATAVALDPSGSVVVTGYSVNYYRDSSDYRDYATVKYSNSGVALWTNRYDGPASEGDEARAAAVDTSGNVYVTGRSRGSGTGYDYATLAYSSAGVPLWTNRYNSLASGNDEAKALALDPGGNVLVTGPSATIKYSPAGVALWTTYAGGDALAVDRNSNAIVTASGATIKFSSDGIPLWTAAGGSAVAVDASGKVFVAGYSVGIGSGEDYVTSAYSEAGVPLWTNRYNGPGNGTDRAQAVAVDAIGNVYVTGPSVGTGGTYDSDYATIKYSNAGAQLWVRRYSAPANDLDWADAVAVDSRGNVVVTGSSASSNVSPYNYDYLTVCYSSAGAQLWVMRYNGPANGNDEPQGKSCLALGPNGEVYVTGASDGDYNSGETPDFATVKYVMALPPLILVSPIDQTNAPGTTASFTVTASGTQPLTYQWRRDGTNLLDGGNVSGVTTTNLLIANVQPADAAEYTVMVANAYGSVVSAAARLTVTGGPSVPPHLENCRCIAGQFAFDLDGDPGCKLLIQASTDLQHWVTLHGCQLTNSPLGFVDPESPLYPKRYYRLMDAAGVALMEQQRWSGGQFHLNLVGELGRTVVVEASSNLSDWTPIATNVLGSGPIPFTDPQSGVFKYRFYRVLMP